MSALTKQWLRRTRSCVAIALYVLCSQVGYAQTENCESSDCEKPAPYVLKIIKSGEGKPRSSNADAAGKQDNRRVDVTLNKKVPVKRIKNKANNESRRVLFGSGGAVWLSKDPTSLDRILTAKTAASVAIEAGKRVEPIEFDIETNYQAFINRMELLVWVASESGANKPIAQLPLERVSGNLVVSWQTDTTDLKFEPGLVLEYAVRAYDAKERFDQSKKQSIRFVLKDKVEKSVLPDPELSVYENAERSGTLYAELDQQGIVFSGTKIRLFGQDFSPDNRLLINDESITIETDGRFGVEYLLPQGEHQFDIAVTDTDGNVLEKKLTTDLDDSYFFMVALADVTAGENKVSGSIAPLSVDEHHYGGDIFVDGRLAFYLKGKVKGKYLITAQMDTGTEDISALFDDFHRKDAQSVFRRLDPDQYYPVYGDESSLVDDTDSQGKLYVRVDWDRSRLIWGNYHTNFTGTEFAPFNRSLYGVQLIHNYLRDTDIVAGSEKVWVEVRQSGTQRVVQKIPMVAGRDYDIDDFQGRLVLNRPLLSVAASGGPSIIRDQPLAGNQTYLVVDYEYSPQNLGTWAHEQRDGDDYDIKGTDITLKKSNQTFIKGEFAQSESSQTSGSFISTDGGLSFTPFNSNQANTNGKAFGFEARLAAADFLQKSRQHEVGVWAKRQHAGFSTANTDVGVNTTDLGIEAVSKPTDKIGLFARASRLTKKNKSTESSLSGQIDYTFSDAITVSSELRNTREQNFVANTNGESTLVAGKVSANVNERLNIYGAQQLTLKHSGSETKNNSTTVGAGYKASNKLSVSSELSVGDRGNSALFGTEVNLSDTYSVYTNYTYSFSKAQVERNSYVLGQRKQLNNQLKVYSEHQFSDEDSRQGYAHTVGLDQQLSKYTSANLSAQRALIENDDKTSTERNTVSLGFAFQKDKSRFNSKFEYRWDEGPGIDKRQSVTTNRFEYRKTPSFRWQGKLNASITDDKLAADDARFIEAGIGFAYRPVKHDRLNMLGRLTYLNDLQPLSQSTETDQRSLVGSMEGLYDLTHTWSIGGKLAHRVSEVRLVRNSGFWIDNDASLASLRARYKATFGIDANAAYHWLNSDASKGTRHGALLSVGRRVGDNLTFSLGYNFTSFDDDLTNDSYDVKGWFVNLIGTY